MLGSEFLIVLWDWWCDDMKGWFYVVKVLIVVFVVLGVLMLFDLLMVKMVMIIVFIVMYL